MRVAEQRGRLSVVVAVAAETGSATNILSISKLTIVSLFDKLRQCTDRVSAFLTPRHEFKKPGLLRPGSVAFSSHPQHTALLPLQKFLLAPLDLSLDQDVGFSSLWRGLTSIPQLWNPSLPGKIIFTPRFPFDQSVEWPDRLFPPGFLWHQCPPARLKNFLSWVEYSHFLLGREVFVVRHASPWHIVSTLLGQWCVQATNLLDKILTHHVASRTPCPPFRIARLPPGKSRPALAIPTTDIISQCPPTPCI